MRAQSELRVTWKADAQAVEVRDRRAQADGGGEARGGGRGVVPEAEERFLRGEEGGVAARADLGGSLIELVENDPVLWSTLESGLLVSVSTVKGVKTYR